MSILPSQHLEVMLQEGFIYTKDQPIPAENIQPASIDLRLGDFAWRIAASFLPSIHESVQDKIQNIQMHKCPLQDGFIFEKGCVYIVPLQEQLNLPEYLYGRANPKSSTGRLDVFARVLTECGDVFDDIPAGYKGQLYVEIAPRTFSIRVRKNDRLVQLRIMDARHKDNQPLKSAPQMTSFTVDVTGGLISKGHTSIPPIIGWRARKHAGLIDLSLINHYPILDYWEPIFARTRGGIILDIDDFYILATNENIEIPSHLAAEMLAYDTSFGEFRVHYAGFFDPGFGSHCNARGVLEVRTHEVPFWISENQVVGRLAFSPMLEEPQKIYGKEMGSNYQGQTLKLAKQFAPFDMGK